MENTDNFKVGIKRQLFHYELRKLREDRGLSQQKLADECSMSVQRYQAIEQLKSYPREEEALSLADFLGFEATDFFPKWTIPAYKYTNKLADRVVEVKRIALNSPEILQLVEPSIVEEELDKELLYDELNSMLHLLSDRERRVIEVRFGLNGEKVHTLEETAKMFYVTRERMRQIEQKALMRLRHYSRKDTLAKYL